MEDSSEKMTSSLALVEKKNQRPGGCVGIFFQLIDWNKRLTKKMFSPKKLLSPVRLKKASKIFGGDEKRPKLRLIANDSNGGIPCIKNDEGVSLVDFEGKPEMQTPGLVARLMGLESMPAVQKKVHLSQSQSDDVAENYVDKTDTYERRKFCVEKSVAKNELRPQKLRKTGSSDRRPASKLETEALQLKSVLSRSRKHHQKLVSPVKSPRNLSGKNPSRLLSAATKILEPGLQNRTKCATNYTISGHNPPKTEPLTQEASVGSLNMLENLNGQSSSCRNCGHFLDVADFTPNAEVQKQVYSSVPRNVDHPCEVFERENPGMPIFCSVQETGNNQRSNTHYSSLSTENGQMFSARGGQRQWRATRKECNIRKHGVNDNRSSIATDRNNASDHSSSTASFKMQYCKSDVHKEVGHSGGDASLSHTQKRRSDNIFSKIEGPGFLESRFSKPVYGRSNLMSGRDINGSGPSSELVHVQESANGNAGKSLSHARFFSFNSPRNQQNTGIHTEACEKVYNESNSGDFSSRRSASQEDDGMKIKREYVPLNDDSLGAFLHQKLRELTSHEQDNESAYEYTTPRRSTAMILQELISALSGGRPPCQQDNLADEFQKISSYFCNRVQSKGYEHFSPGSVLEGTISSESFFSSSMDDSSKLHEGTLLSELDAELLVSETSSNMGKLFKNPITILVGYVSEALSSIDFSDFSLKGSKLAHAKEVILNAEIVFGNGALPGAILSGGFSICNFVQNELDTIASLMWTRFRGMMGFSNAKEGHQLKGFVFDSIIEYLESKFSRYSNTGFNSWNRLPLRMKTELLICEIVEEVGRWVYMSGLTPDELIEYDMSHNFGKWMDFDLEACKTGAELTQLILEVLTDELITDVIGCRRRNTSSRVHDA